MDCKLEFVFGATRKFDEYIELHKHDCYELVYYLKGNGSSKVKEETLVYSPNTFAIIEPDCLHDEKHDTDTDVLFIGFLFNGSGIPLKNGLFTDGPYNNVLRYLNEIKLELSEQKKFFKLKLDLLLKELIIEIERIKSTTDYKTGNLSYIKKFIEENFHQQIDMKALADLTGYSYHRFRHLFKEKTGVSPINYVLNCRLSNAKRLLKTNMSLSDISQFCGFYSESQFSSLFKREIGVSPGNFRKNIT